MRDPVIDARPGGLREKGMTQYYTLVLQRRLGAPTTDVLTIWCLKAVVSLPKIDSVKELNLNGLSLGPLGYGNHQIAELRGRE